jgi:magnesium transporter
MTADQMLYGTYIDSHPTEAARVLERQPSQDVAALLNGLRPVIVANVVERMVPTVGAECLTQMNPRAAAAAVEYLDAAAAAAIFRRLEPVPRDAFLKSLGDAAAPVQALLRHAADTVGSVMDPRALALPDDVTVGEAIARVRRSARHMLYYLYVVDRDRNLVGVLDVSELMQARPSVPLASIAHAPVASLSASSGLPVMLAHPGWTDFHALPVVDEAGLYLGAVRYQTFRRLAEADSYQVTESTATVLALGELYWLGVSGFLKGLATTLAGDELLADGAEEAHRAE